MDVIFEFLFFVLIFMAFIFFFCKMCEQEIPLDDDDNSFC